MTAVFIETDATDPTAFKAEDSGNFCGGKTSVIFMYYLIIYPFCVSMKSRLFKMSI